MQTITLTCVRCLLGLVLVVQLSGTLAFAQGKDEKGGGYYSDAQIYGSRPRVDREMHVGHIGVTGIEARIYKGVILKVEKTQPDSPAHGKFKQGDVINGINGIPLKGKNPFVILGNALTEAEASDGKVVFDVKSGEGAASKKVEVIIPVLGSYSKAWPLNCEKSEKIIRQAAEFYADKKKFQHKGVGGAMACLFLLSTGDDKYLPRVKEYFAEFVKNPSGIGDHTWNNGYNGIACAEYYLRTGDSSVIPVLQHFCDDAKERQKFGCGWTHWGKGINPGYVAGGLMNPAGSQVLTTLLLAKECGAVVDEPTLLGALRFFYRFAGHGTVPYGDHRGEGGLGSNGKDGMIAVTMHVASGAQGDVSIYTKAKRYLSMSMLTSYPLLVRGHGDAGRGDAMWRGIASSYLMEEKPAVYREAMNRLTWWYDLSRRPGGGIGVATCQRFDDVGSGAGVALSYTAPLKTLRITGAPRSKYAKDFELPEHLWGTAADLAFLDIENNPKYEQYGKPEPTHVPYYKFGSAYMKPSDLKSIPRDEMYKNVFHKRYMIRAQAAKALRAVGAVDELEKLILDKDPRVRRAALDGLIDYRYWFSMGRDPLKTEAYTPGMIEGLKKTITDPQEALYVVDGALFAMRNAPIKAISENIGIIMPWTTHEEWWLRESSFMALSGLERDDAEYLKIVPKLLTMMTDEYHTMPRGRMTNHLKSILRKKKKESDISKLILAGMLKAAKESEIKTGVRSPEGAHNVALAISVFLEQTPERAVLIAKAMQMRFSSLGTGQIIKMVATPNSNREGRTFGLYTTLDKLSLEKRKELTDILFTSYRAELIKRMKAAEKEDRALIDTIIDLTKLKNPVAGWSALGKPEPADRVWRFTSFDPPAKEKMHPREKKRFRDVTLPRRMDKWYMPDFDDSKWKSGKAPIGKGLFKRGNTTFKNNSEWGDGEFILMRTNFELDTLDYDSYRISVLASQGFHIYLNGHRIHTYIWWKNMPYYRLIMLGPQEVRHLKKGVNFLAIYSNTEYPKGVPLGQFNVYLEGLRKKDLE